MTARKPRPFVAPDPVPQATLEALELMRKHANPRPRTDEDRAAMAALSTAMHELGERSQKIDGQIQQMYAVIETLREAQRQAEFESRQALDAFRDLVRETDDLD